MSILVNVQNVHEESVLLAFLESKSISYKAIQDGSELESNEKFMEVYNQELDKSDLEIEAGDFISQMEVIALLKNDQGRSE